MQRILLLAVVLLSSLACESEPVEEASGVVISVVENPAGTDCSLSRWPTYTPNPASVLAGGGFTWKNDTTISVTIVVVNANGSDGAPVMTLAPGEQGSFVSYDTVDTYNFWTQGCHGSPNQVTMSRVNVTVTFAP